MWSLPHTNTRTNVLYIFHENAIFFFRPFWARFDGQFEPLFVFVMLMWVNLAYAFYFISFYSFYLFFSSSSSAVYVHSISHSFSPSRSVLDSLWQWVKISLSFGVLCWKCMRQRLPDKIKQSDVAHFSRLFLGRAHLSILHFRSVCVCFRLHNRYRSHYVSRSFQLHCRHRPFFRLAFSVRVCAPFMLPSRARVR